MEHDASQGHALISPETERAIREQLWLTHGCNIACLYGDDGEMQCAGERPFIDFRRESFEVILEGIKKHNLARLAKFEAKSGKTWNQ